MSKKGRVLAVSTVALALGIAGFASVAIPARAAEQAVAGTLELNASLALTSRLGACPLPPDAENCAARTITGTFPGLGSVSSTYHFYVNSTSRPCAGGLFRALSNPIRLVVASKGEIQVTVAEGPCVDENAVRVSTQSFTVTGGTGVYSGVTGSGTLSRVLGEDSGNGRFGQERWTGSMTVPGLEFDTTAPTLSAPKAKTVKAKKGTKNARVVFTVTGQDDKDGAVATACTPRSGSRFKVGRTRVRCSATDSSGNQATASFAVTVKRSR